MSEAKAKLVTPKSLAIDLLLCVAFFLFWYPIISPHVPSEKPLMIALFGGSATFCVTGVFWFCIQMFRLVLRAQREAKTVPATH